jgi:hypothetical protein
MPTRVEGSLKPEKPPGMASIVLALIVLPGSVTSCIMIGIAVVKRQAVSYTYAKNIRNSRKRAFWICLTVNIHRFGSNCGRVIAFSLT